MSMEEKKNRVRPTMAQVKALEQELRECRLECESQMEATSMVQQESDGWRDKYRLLKSRYDSLSQSERRVTDELLRKSDLLSSALSRCEELAMEVVNLKSRGFWSRVFNRNY